MKPAEAAQAVMDSTISKVAGVAGGGTAILGITVETSTVLADLGIFVGGVAALLTFLAGLIKRARDNDNS